MRLWRCNDAATRDIIVITREGEIGMTQHTHTVDEEEGFIARDSCYAKYMCANIKMRGNASTH